MIYFHIDFNINSIWDKFINKILNYFHMKIIWKKINSFMHRNLKKIIIIFIPSILIFSFLEFFSGNDFKDTFSHINNILLIILIFLFSSIWAQRSSSFFAHRQERTAFFECISGKYVRSLGLIDVVNEPASVYLGSSRSLRRNAIIFNMFIFYLLIAIAITTFQFFLLLFPMNFEITWYRIGNYFLLFCSYITILYGGFLYSNTRKNFINKSAIKTYDWMQKIPFLSGKTDEKIYPTVKKEKEMEMVWKKSILKNLKGILNYLISHQTYKYHNEKVIDDTLYLTTSLISSEWKDVTHILLYSMVYKLFSFLENIDGHENYVSISNEAFFIAQKMWYKNLEKKKKIEFECKKNHCQVQLTEYKRKKEELNIGFSEYEEEKSAFEGVWNRLDILENIEDINQNETENIIIKN